MKLAIVAEKPSLFFAFKHLLPDAYPNANLSEIFVFYPIWQWMVGHKRFEFPHGIKWSEYPYVGTPRYRCMNIENGMFARYDKSFAAPSGDTSEMAHKALCDADLILLLVDAGQGGIHLAHRFLTDNLSTIDWDKVLYPWILSLDERTMVRALRNARSPRDFAMPLISEGKTRRFFDFNYAFNSFALTGSQVSKKAGLGKGGPSKYGLQLLYHLSGVEPTTFGVISSQMYNWSGTGKYDPKKYNGMGSAASRSAIIKDLIDGGYLSEKNKMISVSSEGKAYLSFLHPDCRDPDLPFRIRDWSRMPEEDATAKMTKYLKTFFGKQKRYLERSR